jgi:AraC-like DNA-binding protein
LTNHVQEKGAGANVDHTVPKYKIYNPAKNDCPVSSLLNTLYQRAAFQNEQRIPEEIGEGYGQRYILNSATEIFVTDATFYEDLTLGEEVHGSPHYSLAFCLAEPLRWWSDTGKEYEIRSGESYIFNGLRGNNSCTYSAGKRFLGLSMQYDQDVISDLVAQMGKGYAQGLTEGSDHLLYTRKFSPHIRLILNDIIHCRYRGDIKQIYLEGKALELLAVYLDELILENGKSTALPKFSVTDISALNQARDILDADLASPPTIRQLARLVCLNEYKLKAGFRELFGLPIHAYIIDKRLELAQLLMRSQGLGVAEAALVVGYSNTNHFTEKFKEKYGAKPSQYRKHFG